MSPTIHNLSRNDFTAADGILNAAFGYSRDTRAELGRYLSLEPQGWFIARLAGEPAGVVGALNYRAYAYIGMMGVHPKFQRRGVGAALMRHVLQWLQGEGCPLALLDASASGAPLYEKLGFVDHDPVHFFVPGGDFDRRALPANIRPMTAAHLPQVHALDRAVYAADRAAMLDAYFAAYPKRAFVCQGPGAALDGYLIAQEARLGPWAAENPDAAAGLLDAALALTFAQPPLVYCPAANQAGRALLERNGFRLVRSLRHMQLGPGRHPVRRAAIYGQGSFTTG